MIEKGNIEGGGGTDSNWQYHSLIVTIDSRSIAIANLGSLHQDGAADGKTLLVTTMTRMSVAF